MADLERLEQALDGIATDHVSFLAIHMPCHVTMCVRIDTAGSGGGVSGTPTGRGSSSGESHAKGLL